MNIKNINEQYSYIRSLLEEKRLKEALTQLDSFLWQCSDWRLRHQLEHLQTSYSYMLQYMKEGVDDPQRSKLHKKLLTDTWEIADQARLLQLDTISSNYYHEMRRTLSLSEEGNGNHFKNQLQILESFNEDIAVSELLSNSHKEEILVRHESTLKTMFLQIWINSSWNTQDAENALNVLNSEYISTNDLCLFVSAVTLSVMECFDSRKIDWLLEAYQHSATQINQRALIGILILLHIYRKRIPMYPEIGHQIEYLNENTTFSDDAARIYGQLLLCQETEKIDRKMREEIIPEMLKNVSSMRDMRFGLEDSDEESDGINPDWEAAFEESGLSDKIKEMGELQLEGADIYMSTFASLKGYPFFRDLQNWFYPFEKRQSDISREMQQNTEKRNSILDLILQTGFFCNSDKYSFFFTLQQLPQSQRELMLSQLTEQQIQEITEKSNTETLKAHSERPTTISNQYLHDLYRFFKLNSHRNEFRDIFKEKLDLYNIPILSDILYSSQYLLPIADFYLRKERWQEAIDVYKDLGKLNTSEVNTPSFYQKLGYVLQKNKKYQSAIEAYLKADTILPDNAWTIRHLAICYRMSRHYEKALLYYKKVEEVDQNNHNVVFYIANCLAELGQNEEALNYFFKLDFLESNSIKAWRGIGWCSFVNKKYKQALKYYEQIIKNKPLSIDYMNAGHVAWVMNDIQKAIDFYGKALSASESREQFIEIFRKDEEVLVEQGIRGENIPLMLDLL